MEGRFHDAKREYEAVLHGQRHRYGPRHPHVLHTQYNLALLVHNRLGDARGGEFRHKTPRTYAILDGGYDQPLGKNIPLVALIMLSLLRVHRAKAAPRSGADRGDIAWRESSSD